MMGISNSGEMPLCDARGVNTGGALFEAEDADFTLAEAVRQQSVRAVRRIDTRQGLSSHIRMLLMLRRVPEPDGYAPLLTASTITDLLNCFGPQAQLKALFQP